MYPYPVFLGMTLYELMIAFGFVMAVLTYRIHADRLHYPPALQNLSILGGALGIGIGYYAAVLVQAFYNYLDDGIFELSTSTGATFLGGLMGGVAVFFLIYFGAGAIVYRGKEPLNRTMLIPNCDIAITAVVAAHACGRLGCLFAGCCHGAIVDGFPGIYNHSLDAYTIPIPLYEALFLAAIYAIMTVGLIKRSGYQLVFYLAAYGTWRFVIEFFRADERGETIIPFLSPSQLVSLVMLILSAILFAIQRAAYRRHALSSDVCGKIASDPLDSTEQIAKNAAEDKRNGENSVESGENS